MDAGVFVGALSQELKKKSIPLSPHLRGRYGKEFKHALSEEVPDADLYRAIGRIAERWEDHQLTLSQALRDVRGAHRNGSAGSATTPEERKRGADERIRQALEKGLIKADPRRPLTKEERGRNLDEELKLLRGSDIIEEVAS